MKTLCQCCGGAGGFTDVCETCYGLEPVARCWNRNCKDGQVSVACDRCHGKGLIDPDEDLPAAGGIPEQTPGGMQSHAPLAPSANVAGTFTEETMHANHQEAIRSLVRHGGWTGLGAEVEA